jgi:glycosyltransferase involved in cell wall biosynthesis
MLEVLMTSTSYPKDHADWRGRFVANLVASLSKHEKINLRLWAPSGLTPSLVQDAKTPLETLWLERLMADGGIAAILRKKNFSSLKTAFFLLLFLTGVYHRNRSANLVHSLWLQNALPLLGSRRPAVISVLGSDFGLLRVPGMILLLRAMLKTRPCLIAPNATWMAPRLRGAFGDLAEIRPIPFGVDEKWFTLQKNISKNNKFHWVSVTRITSKKIGSLFKWGKGLFGQDHILHLFGPMQETLSIPEWVDYRGPVGPNELMNKWFPLCSGLITLSRHDEGRPQVMLEAMAAGLPIIASDIPAHMDFIEHKVNGWIVSTPQDLKDAISFFNTHEAVRRAGESARSWALKNIGTWDDCARRYITAYHDLLGRNR